jgi:hypothetical protein
MVAAPDQTQPNRAGQAAARPGPGARLVAEATRVLIERGKLITRLLDERKSLQGQIRSLGGPAAPDAIEAVRVIEQRLQDVDEALGVLRYGSVPGELDPARGGATSRPAAERSLRIEKALRLPAQRSPVTQQLLQRLAPERKDLERPDAPYVSPVSPAHRADLDAVMDAGETGYSLILGGGGRWLDHPGPVSSYRMYTKNGTSSDPVAKYNLVRASDDLDADTVEDVEGNVINDGSWPPVSFAHVRPRPDGGAVETTPQGGVVTYLRDQGHAFAQAARLHKKYVADARKRTGQPSRKRRQRNEREISTAVPGSWYVPDMLLLGDFHKPPRHFAEVTVNYRDTPAGRQVVYTKGRALPGFRQRRGYVHESMRQFLKSYRAPLIFRMRSASV